MGPGGLEPPTVGSEDRCSIQLSYGPCRGIVPHLGRSHATICRVARRRIPAYRVGMPKPPLIQNRGRREAVIAVILAVALCGSLLMAWLISGAPLF